MSHQKIEDYRPTSVVKKNDGLDLHNPQVYQQFIETLTLEPIFSCLPKTRNENPHFFDQVKYLFTQFAEEGSIVIYSEGVNIHEVRPGEMQIILSSELQMKANRDSLKIPELKKLGFNGPHFHRGQVLGSWSMAGQTGSHFAEIYTLEPTITFSISGKQYARLIELTIKENHGVSYTKTSLSDEQVNALYESGVLKKYSSEFKDLLIIPRQRDFDKIENKSLEATDLWKNNQLFNCDFLYKIGDNWYTYNNVIQRAIKESTVIQHVLQKHFLTSQDEKQYLANRISRAFNCELNNDEMLALSRNIKSVQSDSISINSGPLLLITKHESDVEYPKYSLKDPKNKINGEVEIEANIPDVNISFKLQLPENGVLDLIELQSIIAKQYNISSICEIEITRIEISSEDQLSIYQLNHQDYLSELRDSFSYSADRMLRDLANIGYTISIEDNGKINKIIQHGVEQFEKTSLGFTNLKIDYIKDIINLVGTWANRDLKDRRNPLEIPMDKEKVAEIETLIEIYINSLGKEPKVFNQYLIDTFDAKNKIQAKLRIIYLSTFAPEAIKEIDNQQFSQVHYKDQKFAFSRYTDEYLRDQYVRGMLEETTLENANLEWSKAIDSELLFVGDRHEDYWGMLHELRALGILKYDNEIDASKLADKRLIYLGDLINRQPGKLGLAALELVEKIYDAVDEYNATLEGVCYPAQVTYILGNHELDLLKTPDNDLSKIFTNYTDLKIALDVKNKLKKLIMQDQLVVGEFLGSHSANDNLHATITHSIITPTFKAQIYQELVSQRKTPSDIELILYLNKILKAAVINNDYNHSLFAKSNLRGGKSEFSGCIEADMGNRAGTDLEAELNKIFQHEIDIDLARKLFGNQVVGHNFSTEEENIRVCHLDHIYLTGCIITDTGDHQNVGPNPTKPVQILSVKNGSAKIIRPNYIEPPPLPDNESAVYNMKKNPEDPKFSELRDWSYRVNNF